MSKAVGALASGCAKYGTQLKHIAVALPGYGAGGVVGHGVAAAVVDAIAP
ncbi:hypothetical protein [Rhizobium leguminosarum]|nr:hypothetical protein [Rhizobium leguminosarum]